MEYTIKLALGLIPVPVPADKDLLHAICHRFNRTVYKVSHAVDPASVGGAVAGLTVGEVAGTAAGGAVGLAVAGPPGAILGSQLGALAVGSAGLKIGYDVTYEATHPGAEQYDNLQERVVGVGRRVVTRSGDALGSGVGGAGGVVVGTAIAGPVGGAVGALVGETFGGDIVESSSKKLVDNELKKGRNPRTPKGKASKQPPWHVKFKHWVTGVTRDTTMEAGSSAAVGVLGRLVAGPLGQRVGERAGLIAARQGDWQDALDEQTENQQREDVSRQPWRPARKKSASTEKTVRAVKKGK